MSEKATNKKAPPRPEMPKYNVSTLATDLGTDAQGVRVMLRKSGLPKPGPVWGWDTKAAYEDVLKKLKAPKAEKAAKPAKAEKPVKAAKTAKA